MHNAITDAEQAETWNSHWKRDFSICGDCKKEATCEASDAIKSNKSVVLYAKSACTPFVEWFTLSACRHFENCLKILKKSRFQWMFHVFGSSRSPPCFFGCLLGHPWAVRFRLMFHTLDLLGQFVLHAICIFNKRCTSWFPIQYYTSPTFYSVWSLTLCLFFAVASHGKVSFSMNVSRFWFVQHRLLRFTCF